MNRDNVALTFFSKGQSSSPPPPQPAVPPSVTTPGSIGSVGVAEPILEGLPVGAVYEGPIANRGLKRKNGFTPIVFTEQMDQLLAVEIAAVEDDTRNQKLRAALSDDPCVRRNYAATATSPEKARRKKLQLAKSTYVSQKTKSVSQKLAGTFFFSA